MTGRRLDLRRRKKNWHKGSSGPYAVLPRRVITVLYCTVRTRTVRVISGMHAKPQGRKNMGVVVSRLKLDEEKNTAKAEPNGFSLF